MEETLHSNLIHLVHIKICDKQLSSRYEFKPKFKGWNSPFTWLNPPRPDMVYEYGSSFELQEFLSTHNHTLIDGEIWVKPYVELYFNNSQRSVNYYRDTIEDVVKLRNTLLGITSTNGVFREIKKL